MANRAVMSVLAMHSLLVPASLSPVLDVRLLGRFQLCPVQPSCFLVVKKQTPCSPGREVASPMQPTMQRYERYEGNRGTYHIDQHPFQVPKKLLGRNVRQPAARSGKRGEDETRAKQQVARPQKMRTRSKGPLAKRLCLIYHMLIEIETLQPAVTSAFEPAQHLTCSRLGHGGARACRAQCNPARHSSAITAQNRQSVCMLPYSGEARPDSMRAGPTTRALPATRLGGCIARRKTRRIGRRHLDERDGRSTCRVPGHNARDGDHHRQRRRERRERLRSQGHDGVAE
jgi:hypothetical protein